MASMILDTPYKMVVNSKVISSEKAPSLHFPEKAANVLTDQNLRVI